MDNALIYLDNAATVWPKPETVYQFMIDFYRGSGVNPGRSGFDAALEAGSLLDRLRQRLQNSLAAMRTHRSVCALAITPPMP